MVDLIQGEVEEIRRKIESQVRKRREKCPHLKSKAKI
jgi:hypothetical protein